MAWILRALGNVQIVSKKKKKKKKNSSSCSCNWVKTAGRSCCYKKRKKKSFTVIIPNNFMCSMTGVNCVWERLTKVTIWNNCKCSPVFGILECISLCLFFQENRKCNKRYPKIPLTHWWSIDAREARILSSISSSQDIFATFHIPVGHNVKVQSFSSACLPMSVELMKSKFVRHLPLVRPSRNLCT